MRVAILGTGAIANKHAQAYRNIGFDIVACSNKTAERGEDFARRWGTRFVATTEELCTLPGVDFVDVTTFPDSHLEPVKICAGIKRAIQVQKPMAANLETAREILRIARASGISLSVVSQHRFDDATIFLKRALGANRLGKLLQADAYVKWYRSDEYYSRPIKGSWSVEGGGALINQAIHQVDILLYLLGPVDRVAGMWQLGAHHKIESEDVVNGLLAYRSGATGVIQASTAMWPGYSERIEIHGTKGSAIVTGDRLTAWDVMDDEPANAADPAPVESVAQSGASDPMNISVTTFERQFLDFSEAIRNSREPLCNADAGFHALELVLGIYRACKEQRVVGLG